MKNDNIYFFFFQPLRGQPTTLPDVPGRHSRAPLACSRGEKEPEKEGRVGTSRGINSTSTAMRTATSGP